MVKNSAQLGRFRALGVSRGLRAQFQVGRESQPNSYPRRIRSSHQVADQRRVPQEIECLAAHPAQLASSIARCLLTICTVMSEGRVTSNCTLANGAHVRSFVHVARNALLARGTDHHPVWSYYQ